MSNSSKLPPLSYSTVFRHQKRAKKLALIYAFVLINAQTNHSTLYNESIPSKLFASIPIIYEIAATDREIIVMVTKFLRKGSSFATDI